MTITNQHRQRTDRQRGVSLVEVMGAMTVMALIAVSLVMWVKQQQQSARSQLLGLQMTGWRVYAQDHLISAARSDANPFALTAEAPIKAISLPAAGYLPEVLMSASSQSRFLAWMQGRNAAGQATNAMSQRYCLLLERKEPVLPATTPSIEGVLLTVGGDSLTEGMSAEALMVMGPQGGRIGDTTSCAPLGAGCLTNGIGANHNGWRKSMETKHNNAITAACGQALSTGHLAYILDNAVNTRVSGDPLYRVSFFAANGTAEATAAAKSLNTMRHDLVVRGDITAGLSTQTAGVACLANLDNTNVLARASDGKVLHCVNNTWQVPQNTTPTVKAAPSFFAASRLATGYIGLDGAGALQQSNTSITTVTNSNIRQVCMRKGDFRRDEIGGVIGCQVPEGGAATDPPIWDRMGANTIRWKMLQNPIAIDFPTPLGQYADGEKTVNDFKALFPSALNLNTAKMRMVLLHLKSRPSIILDTANSAFTSNGSLCSPLPWNPVTAFTYSTRLIMESEIVADATAPCKIDLRDIFVASETPQNASIDLKIIGYLCEGNKGCDP